MRPIERKQGGWHAIPTSHGNDSDLNHELREAVYNGDLDAVIRLVDAGADVNQVFLGSPLICLASQSAVINPDKEQSLAIVKFLIARGADVLVKDDFGWTAFDWAICCILEGAAELRDVLKWGIARSSRES